MEDFDFFEGEEWRPVVGYEGAYEVSSFGRVRSLDRTVTRIHTRWGTPYQHNYRGRLLKPLMHSAGYLQVKLGLEDMHLIHVLVSAAFIGPCPEGQEVRHKDDHRNNPSASNLEYGTRQDNMDDMWARGRARPWGRPQRVA